MLPGLVWFVLFAYGPMSGLLLAFKTYSAKGGIWGSEYFESRILISTSFSWASSIRMFSYTTLLTRALSAL